ncbi:MAG TPA: penicillin-binding transpeptidase domain-containing protein [Polyangia bacterium]|nr:penicillin-binding transpeptidase domain-containing protein [Polyangia bacterium]
MIAATRWTRIRLVACGVGFGLLFTAVGRRAYHLQVVQADHLRTMAEEQYLREIELPPRRGRILDRNGAELASTADVDSIYCNPRRLPDVRDASRRLAYVLGLERRELEKKLSQKRFFAWVKRKVTPDEVTAVRALNLPGIAFTREPRRFYPNRTLAATVMGHAGSDGGGLDGVELSFDKYLRGSTSSVQGVRDALGRDLMVEGMADMPTGVGSDVVLTIDRYLTFVTEKALADATAAHHAKSVIAVVMDPSNGEVLAMASTPTYNPNDPGGAAENGARNRAITDAFEPGSTMKTFTISAALDARAVRADEKFDCLMGRMMVGRYQIHDTHPHGVLTVAEVFKFSSNIGATKIARRLGRDEFARALDRFGFGHQTEIGLPGERSGIIRPVSKWGDIGFANASFGQGLTVTPLQMIAGVSAIASGGVYHQPHVVARIVNQDGSVETPALRPDRRVISADAARTMVGIMRGVTEPGGTAKQAAIPGYPVAGKTGTAQKVANGHYDSSKWVASFIGFAPADDPRVAIIVVVDEPQGDHLGGAVAAPVFREIGEQALRYLHVPPSAAALAAASKADGATDKHGKKAAAATSSADTDDDVSPDFAASDAPADPTLGEDGDLDGNWDSSDGAEGAASGGRNDAVVVPNFAGLSIAEAIHAARRSGVELSFDDTVGGPSGVAVKQKPAPGPAARGTPIRVAFGRRE